MIKLNDLKIGFYRYLFYTVLILIAIFATTDDAGRVKFLTNPIEVIILASLGSLVLSLALLLYDLSEFKKTR